MNIKIFNTPYLFDKKNTKPNPLKYPNAIKSYHLQFTGDTFNISAGNRAISNKADTKNLSKGKLLGLYDKFSFRGRDKSEAFGPNEIGVNIPGLAKQNVQCSLVKEIILKDANNKDVPALIMSDDKIKTNYYVCTKKDDKYETLCAMSILDKGDCIFINSLDGQNNNGVYKGAGTELLKVAVEESLKRGYGGWVELLAIGSLPFYYKNNLTVLKTPSEAFQTFNDCTDFPVRASMNALIDYFARDNSGLAKVWPADWVKPEMELAADAVNAFMNGERLYENNKSELMHSVNISHNNGTYCADVIYCEVPTYDEPGKSVIQLIQKDDRYIKWLASVEMTFDKNKEQKYLNIDKINFDDKLICDKGENVKKALKEELLKAVKIKAEELGACPVLL